MYKDNEIESVVREVIYENGTKVLIVACIYKHPNADSDNFTSLYSNLLDKIISENKKAIIMGDFNYDLLRSESNEVIEDFLNMNLTHCFIPTISRPTRITPNLKL